MSDTVPEACGLIEDEIRKLVASAAEREGISVSVEVDQGRVTLWGDALGQQALAEIVDSLLSLAAVTQIHTRLCTH